MSDDAWAAMEWTRRRLGAAHLDFIKRLPLSLEDDGRFYVHASANAPGEWTETRSRGQLIGFMESLYSCPSKKVSG
jgi:diadenosine tetraphosphatase ApaH/serine/threonine PP2A family protein phosphatase